MFDRSVVPRLLPAAVPEVELEELVEPPDEPPEPPPDPPPAPPPCASANVELRARTEANAVAINFMRVSVRLMMTSITRLNYLMFQPLPAERDIQEGTRRLRHCLFPSASIECATALIGELGIL